MARLRSLHGAINGQDSFRVTYERFGGVDRAGEVIPWAAGVPTDAA